MCRVCDCEEAQEFRLHEINRIGNITPYQEQLLAMLRSTWRSGGEEQRKNPSSDSGHPTLEDFRKAGLPVSIDRAYRGVLRLIRNSTPTKPLPVNTLTLHVNVQKLFGNKKSEFAIGCFVGWVLHIKTRNSDSADTHTVVARPDGALLKPPPMGEGIIVTITNLTQRPVTWVPSPAGGLRSVPSMLSYDAKSAVKKAVTDLARFAAKSSTTDELEVVNDYFEHDALSSLLSCYDRYYT